MVSEYDAVNNTVFYGITFVGRVFVLAFGTF